MITQEFINKKLVEAQDLETKLKQQCQDSWTRLMGLAPFYTNYKTFMPVISLDKSPWTTGRVQDGDTENKYIIFPRDGKTPETLITGENDSHKTTMRWSLDGFQVTIVPKTGNVDSMSGINCNILVGFIEQTRGTGNFRAIDSEIMGGKMFHMVSYQKVDDLFTSQDDGKNYTQTIGIEANQLNSLLAMRMDNKVDIEWLKSLSQRVSTGNKELTWQPCQYFQNFYTNKDWQGSHPLSQTTEGLTTYLREIENGVAPLQSALTQGTTPLTQTSLWTNQFSNQISASFRKYTGLYLVAIGFILYKLINKK